MLHSKLFYFSIILCLTGCGLSMDLKDIPVTEIPSDELKKQLYTFAMDDEKVKELVDNPEISTDEKINTFAEKGTIRDIVLLLWYLSNEGRKLEKNPSILHSIDDIFRAKVDKNVEASLECVEGAMIAATILQRKNIQPYLLFMNGFNMVSGHAVCLYRTEAGWGTIGVNESDFIEPTKFFEFFRKRLNQRFQYASQNRSFSRNILIYSLRTPEEVNSNFVNSEPLSLSWLNLGTFFRGTWF